jgi:hypothetical protein
MKCKSFIIITLADENLKTAAYNLIHDLKNYRELGSLRRGVEEAKKQFEDFQNFTLQKQQAVITLMNLQLAGYSKKDINELVAVVSTWNRSVQMGNPGLSQGNGHGKKKLDAELWSPGHWLVRETSYISIVGCY